MEKRAYSSSYLAWRFFASVGTATNQHNTVIHLGKAIVLDSVTAHACRFGMTLNFSTHCREEDASAMVCERQK
eukprot:830547-Amphidinium_carterae.2